MNTLVTSLAHDQPCHSSAFQSTLSSDMLRQRVPAVFAPGAHERTSPSYTFISTARVLDALKLAGFEPVAARQAARAKSLMHARHLIGYGGGSPRTSDRCLSTRSRPPIQGRT